MQYPDLFVTSFAHDSTAVSAEARDLLDFAVTAYTAARPPRVLVTGYTFELATPAADAALSRRRAEAVRDYLVGRGIPATAIEVRALGRSNIAAATDEGARRVEVSFPPSSAEEAGRR